MNLAPNPISLNDFTNAPDLALSKACESGAPIAITENGQSKGILLNPRDFELMVSALNLSSELLNAEADVQKGQTRLVSDFFEEFWDGQLHGEANPNS